METIIKVMEPHLKNQEKTMDSELKTIMFEGREYKYGFKESYSNSFFSTIESMKPNLLNCFSSGSDIFSPMDL